MAKTESELLRKSIEEEEIYNRKEADEGGRDRTLSQANEFQNRCREQLCVLAFEMRRKLDERLQAVNQRHGARRDRARHLHGLPRSPLRIGRRNSFHAGVCLTVRRWWWGEAGPMIDRRSVPPPAPSPDSTSGLGGRAKPPRRGGMAGEGAARLPGPGDTELALCSARAFWMHDR